MTLDAEYFAAMYAGAADPWSLATRWYERRKYALTVAGLPRPRYRSALEVGCSVGVLTAELAARSDALLAVDIDPRAVRAAADRTRDLTQVRVEQRDVAADWPAGTFDLIVLSEVLYYFVGADAARVVERAVAALEPGGTLVAVHWRHPVADYPRTGDEVHAGLAELAGRLGLARVVRHEELDFLQEVYLRTPPQARSVAQREGLA